MNYRIIIPLIFTTLSAIHGAHHAAGHDKTFATLQALVVKQPASKKAASDIAARIQKLVAEVQAAAALVSKKALREMQIQLLALQGPNAPAVKKSIIAYGTELCLTEPCDRNALILHPGTAEDVLRAHMAYTLSQAAQAARADAQHDQDAEGYDNADVPLPAPVATAPSTSNKPAAPAPARYFFDPRGWVGW